MSANFNNSVPAAPSNAKNVTWQSDVSGNISAYLPTVEQTASNVDLTAQVANIGTATLITPAASGLFRVSVYIILTSVGTTSTLPSVVISWTDPDSSVAQSVTLTAASPSGNTTTTLAQGTFVIDAKISVVIQYATTSYASTGSAMQYALHIRTEAL